MCSIQIKVSRIEHQIIRDGGKVADLMASVTFLDEGVAARRPTIHDIVDVLDVTKSVAPHYNLYKVRLEVLLN